jgi:hypothetical protein
MTNHFGAVLHDESVRWAAAEGVPETVIAAVRLLHERNVDEIVPALGAAELEQVIKLVSRCPSCYPPGALEAFKSNWNTASLAALTAESVPPNVAAKEPALGTSGVDHLYRRYPPRHRGLGRKGQQTITERASGADAPQNTAEAPAKPLALITRWCQDHSLPALASLVVEQATGLPAPGFAAVSRDQNSSRARTGLGI